jgi:hypothetical protein
MRPAVGVLHATGFADPYEVLKGLSCALLPLALSDGHACFKFFQLAVDYVRNAVFNLVDV